MMNTKLITIAGVLLIANTAFAGIFSAGHADIGLVEHNELKLHLHVHQDSIVDGTALLEDGEYGPSDATILVPDSTRFLRPGTTAWDLIGNNSGDDTWLLPESESDAQSMGAPFLGIGAEIEEGVFVHNELTLTLLGVTGPGHFSMYNLSLGSPTFKMSSFDGISSNDFIVLEHHEEEGSHEEEGVHHVHMHAHYNFAFSEAGLYQVTFEVSAIDAATQKSVSDIGTFNFNVVPEPAAMVLLAFGGIAVFRKKK